MIFSRKLAKIGKVKCVHIKQVDGNNFAVFVSQDKTVRKPLVVNGISYSLGKANKTYLFDEMQKVSTTYAVARSDNNFFVVED